MFRRFRFMRTIGLILVVSCFSVAAQHARIAVVDVQSAIWKTAEGRMAAQEIEATIAPWKKHLDETHVEIRRRQKLLSQISSVMGSEGQSRLFRDLHSLHVDYECFTVAMDAEFQSERQRVAPVLQAKLKTAIRQLAQPDGFILVLDSSSPHVRFAATDITQALVDFYDKTH